MNFIKNYYVIYDLDYDKYYFTFIKYIKLGYK